MISGTILGMCSQTACTDYLLALDGKFVQGVVVTVDGLEEHAVVVAELCDRGADAFPELAGLSTVSLSSCSWDRIVGVEGHPAVYHEEHEERRVGISSTAHKEPLYGVLLMMICGPGLLWLARCLWPLFIQ